MNTYTAFLRVRHPSIDPAEITRELGLQPAHAWAAGSPRTSVATARTAHPESYWFAPLGESLWPNIEAVAPAPPTPGPAWPFVVPNPPLEMFLLAMLRLLTPHKGFFARISTEGGRCELAVTMSARDRFSIELPPPLLRALAALELSVTLDVTTGEEPVAH